MSFRSVIISGSEDVELSPVVARFLEYLFSKNPVTKSQQTIAELNELDKLALSYILPDSNIVYRLATLVGNLVDRIESKVGPISHNNFWEFLEKLPVVDRARWALFEIAIVVKDQMASPSQEIKELKSLSKKIRMQLSFLDDAKAVALSGGQASESEIADLEKVLKATIESSKKLLGNYF